MDVSEEIVIPDLYNDFAEMFFPAFITLVVEPNEGISQFKIWLLEFFRNL